MNEMLLHYFWKNKIVACQRLETTDHREVRLLRPGHPHQDAGPDFKQAVIRIGDITWVGDVEIHVRSSDWLRHGHQNDPKYQSLILHVVYSDDVELGLSFPTLELKEHIPPGLIEEYERLSRSPDPLPCRNSLAEVPPLVYTSWLGRLAMERLERRVRDVTDILHACREDWREAVFRYFVMNFGFRTNTAAFEALAKSLPYRYLLKHKDSRLQVYALVFGQAGMLDECDEPDDYFLGLQSEYQYLQYKYQLVPVAGKMWNLLRLRPQNFPCVRLAQLSECLYRIPDIIDRMLYGDIAEPFSGIASFEPHSYWSTHRHFGRASPAHSSRIGRQTVTLLLINTVVTVRFAYAAFHGNDVGKEAAMSLLESADFERNSVTSIYAEAGFPAQSALCSQAILELQRHYCSPKRCVQCDIGCRILKGCDE